ncbi:MAG: hypothetical protein WBV82_24645 [Myxococcaceae bacterium]
MSSWSATASGSTLGQGGPQGGPITRDEENARGFRLIVEEDPERSLFAITVTIPEWLHYARFFESSEEAFAALAPMRDALDALAPDVPPVRPPPGDPRTYEVGAKLSELMTRFP